MHCRAFLELPAATENSTVRAGRVNRNSIVAARQSNNELKLTIKQIKAKRSCRFRFSLRSPPFHIFTGLSHCHFIHCYLKKKTKKTIIATLTNCSEFPKILNVNHALVSRSRYCSKMYMKRIQGWQDEIICLKLAFSTVQYHCNVSDLIFSPQKWS